MGEELGGVKEGETAVRMYSMRENSMLFINKQIILLTESLAACDFHQ